MITSSWDRSRCICAVASAITVTGVVVCAVILALGVSLPEAWWPRTGQALAAGTRGTHHDRCALIIGPAKAYCERGITRATDRPGGAGAAWRLGSAGAGAAALLVWRLRHTAGQGRR
ncbi:hypothetical protein ACFWJM_05785 [Streptomyces sp. NPDC127077]|uniref:hypothetical protein n=1 Tax=Streptomyces sp. NPDC127077 TaxID=3347131 RepID=UPI0036641409